MSTLNDQEVHLLPLRPNGGTIYHVFFITGNPGLIGYYHSFLTLLADKLALARHGVAIYGHSLANFVDEFIIDGTGSREGRKILGLQGQIEYVEGVLRSYVDGLENASSVEDSAEPPKIILVGHSVGAYIGLEIIRRWTEEEERKMRVIGLVGLWPTVTWIGESPSGKRFGWLARLPYLEKVVACATKVLTAIVSRSVLHNMVKFVTGMPDDAANVTSDFLCSPNGVEQALHMARDEMLQITEDRWADDIWGSATKIPGIASPKLIFYFGKNDHWVADHMRDELIASRGSRTTEDELWRSKMLIDDEDIPHGFCIHHNVIAASKCASFIDETIEADRPT